MVRVLKPTGSLFVNLGDSYAGGGGYAPDAPSNVANRKRAVGSSIKSPKVAGDVPAKSLRALPWRYAIGCMDTLGLILRAPIIWHKPNGLPESVRDRVRMDYETVFHLVKQPRYYAAVDEVREVYSQRQHPSGRGWLESDKAGVVLGRKDDPHGGLRDQHPNPLGKLPGSVWSMASEPLRVPDHLDVQHYAAFPSELPRRMILGWSPPGICVECEQGRWPVVDRRTDTSERPNGYQRTRGMHDAEDDGGRPNGSAFGVGPSVRGVTDATILGYACACTPHTNHPGSGNPERSAAQRGTLIQGRSQKPRGNDMQPIGPWTEYHLDGWRPPPTRPAVILDPFAGTGTTLLVARALGRIGVGVDLHPDYCRLARWRVFHSDAASKAIGRTNLERQGSLL